MSDAGTSIGRAVLIGVLMLATLGFGLAGLCGGVITAMSLPEVFSPPRHENYSAAVLIISVPSLLIGGLLAWLCARKLARMLSRKD